MIVANKKRALTLDPRGHYDDYDPNSSENNPDFDNEWPTDHHPKAGDRTMGEGAKDLWRAPGAKFAPGSPGAFKKKR